jgi:hypothetical protein
MPRSDADRRLPSVPATFRANNLRSRDRVPPVSRASSGSFGRLNKLCAGPSGFAIGCLRAGIGDTSMLLLVFGTVWKRVQPLNVVAIYALPVRYVDSADSSDDA